MEKTDLNGYQEQEAGEPLVAKRQNYTQKNQPYSKYHGYTNVLAFNGPAWSQTHLAGVLYMPD